MNLVSIFQTLFPNIQRHHISNHVAALSNQVNITTTIFTRNEIERTLLLHQPDRIKTLSLPIQRLPAFESIGPYLSNLVRFELFGISWLFDFNPAIKFVQQHSMLFGTIQELKLTGPDDVHLLQKPGLHQMLNSIKSPRVIDLSKFKEAAKDMSSYELQSYQTLEVLLFDLNFVPPLPSPSFPTLHDMQTSTQPNLINGPKYIQHEVDHSLDLIQKCSRMTTLHVGVQSSTAFTWAVSKYDADPSRIQPFKTLRLSSNETGTIKQALEDCVYAFRDTIEELEGIAFCNSSFDPALSRSPSFRWTWYLQRLTVLSLEGEIATWFDMNSLKFCPKLTEFKLVLYPYSPVKAEYIEDIILAPQIKVLSFRGRWILTDSLMCILGDGLLKLEKLLVDGCECDELTDNGLFQGLNKMKALKTFEVELGQRIGTLMRLYRPTRPDLSIRMRSDEAPWLDDETRLTPVFRPY
ncbi:hypothetical protein FBU30_000180 [Linnemannia zychae]|nr:hypothetical protein FBU30_000180 [Linnemannia zychae]